MYQEAADRLRQQIFSRVLEPGSWIDEMKLTQQFGISRTPLREALKVLAVEGLVTMKLAEHRALMHAIEARDAKTAQRLMHAHFETGLEAAA